MQYHENGFAVIDNFLNDEEVLELSNAGLGLCADAPESERKIFRADQTEASKLHLKDNYFLDSSNKISFFYEDEALDANGNLLVDRYAALNKVQFSIRRTCQLIKTWTRISTCSLPSASGFMCNTKSNRYFKSNYHRLDMRCTYYIQHSKSTQ